jgi:hypothetical protein
MARQIDAKVENLRLKKWREPAQASVLSILFIASHRGVDVEVIVSVFLTNLN